MPIKEWKPTSRQEEFLSLPDSVFEALYGGAAGGGKTETLLMLPIVKKTKQAQPLYTHPRFKMLFLRRTYPELDSEVIPRSKELYQAVGFNPFNDQKRRWVHPSGAIVQFGHCELEKDVSKYDTSEYTVICWDEATSFTPYQYEYLTFSRCRTSSPDLTAYVRSGTNPGNIGHSYFRKRFIEPCKDGGVILRESRNIQGTPYVLKRIFIPSKVSDNPHILQNDPLYIARLNQLPEKDRAAKADGDWYAYSGQVFSNFRERKMPGEPDHALHVVEPFMIPNYWARILAIDWGYSANMVAGWYAVNPMPTPQHRAKIYKYREYVCSKTNISVWASNIKKFTFGENLVDTALDPSAWGRRGDEFTIAEQFTQHSGIAPRKADNDRIGGKLALQEFLRWEENISPIPTEKFSEMRAWQIYKEKGLAGMQKYLEVFKNEINTGEILPKFQIFNTCKETIRVLPLCNYKKDKEKPSTSSEDDGNAEDVEEFRGDDAYDETRYGIKACQYFLSHGRSEHERQEEIAKVCSVFEQPNPSPSQITDFYRRMGDIEASTAIGNRPIKKFHGSRLPFANF